MKSKLLWRNKNKKKAQKLLDDIVFETISDARKRDYLHLKAKCFESAKDFDRAYAFFKDEFIVKEID